MATQKKKTASKTDKTVEFNEAAHHAREAKKPTKASEFLDKNFPAKKPTKAPKVKPAKLDPALSTARGVPTATPKAKRTVTAPENGLSGVPVHSATSVAELAKILGDFPRGATFSGDQYFGKGRIFIYNLRGKLIAEVRQIDKKAKTARADKL